MFITPSWFSSWPKNMTPITSDTICMENFRFFFHWADFSCHISSINQYHRGMLTTVWMIRTLTSSGSLRTVNHDLHRMARNCVHADARYPFDPFPLTDLNGSPGELFNALIFFTISVYVGLTANESQIFRIVSRLSSSFPGTMANNWT